MAYKRYNPNPNNSNVGDCVIRALTLALNTDWNSAYTNLALQGYMMCDMPSANHVWGALLEENGYIRHVMPNRLTERYTVADFCIDNPYGIYVLATGSHVIAVKDGDYCDSWDSGNEIPIYYFSKE